MSLAINIDEALIAQAAAILEACRACGALLATAESCTGGLLAATFTAVPGSSDVFERGFVTYSNSAKSEMLGVPYWLIERHGAVSRDVARAMAGGAITHSRASVSVAITGIAGPEGGTPDKPTGLVYLAVARARQGRREELGGLDDERCDFGNVGRAGVRRLSVERALALLASLL